MQALEKRDEDKLKNDEAKNEYESLIYEFRSWLNDDDNTPYVPEADRESLVEKCTEGEDWIYEDGAEAGFKVYQSRTYELRSDYSRFLSRKEGHATRDQLVAETFEALSSARDKI